MHCIASFSPSEPFLHSLLEHCCDKSYVLRRLRDESQNSGAGSLHRDYIQAYRNSVSSRLFSASNDAVMQPRFHRTNVRFSWTDQPSKVAEIRDL